MLSKRRPLAFDTETNGLFQYSQGFELRLVQWGDSDLAWVFVNGDPWARKSIDFVMDDTDLRIIAHNATYDALVIDSQGWRNGLELLERMHDTRILSHLVDPRSKSEGANLPGHGLKDLARHYVDENAADSDKALKKLFKDNGWKIADGWKKIPKYHPTLIHYAGLDVILTARLYPKLYALCEKREVAHLIAYEHRLMILCADMERRGIRVDVGYAQQLYDSFDERKAEYLKICADHGVKHPDAPQEVVAALLDLGEPLIEKTATGNFKADKRVLEDIISREGPGAKLAEAVQAAKNANKWRESYVGSTLELMDERDRVHPKINSIAARTARMSVANPPVHQLPSGLSEVRHMFLAEENCSMASIDFSGVELRVMAALSQDPVLMQAFRDGADIHQMTADAAGVSRKVGKTIAFGKAYGGGAKGLARQAGVTVDVARHASKRFDEQYSGLTAYTKKLSRPVEKGVRSWVLSHSKRRLPVDQERSYAALNYVIQSTARDVLGKAMLSVWRAGLWDLVVLPIHDELLCSLPNENAEELAREIGVLMEMDLQGVHIPTEPDLGGESWGSLYEGSGEGDETDYHRVLQITEQDRSQYTRNS